jgi:hypothetical protein
MQTDQTIYLTDATTIAIERVPSKGLVRIKITGKAGGFADELSLTIWGIERTMPEITDTTSDEPSVVHVLAELDTEEADI